MFAIVHFALGMAIGIEVASRIPRLSALGVGPYAGFVALGPDISKFIPVLTWLHDSFWANLFVFHGLIDSMETSYPNVEALVALFVLFVVLIRHADITRRP